MSLHRTWRRRTPNDETASGRARLHENVTPFAPERRSCVRVLAACRAIATTELLVPKAIPHPCCILIADEGPAHRL